MAKKGIKKKVVADALKGMVRLPDRLKISACFVQLSGGEMEFSRLLYENFKDAPPGSLARIRIMDLVLKGLEDVGQRDAGDMADLSEEDLYNRVKEIVGEIGDEEEGDLSGSDSGGPAAAGPAGPVVAAGGLGDESPPAGATADPGSPEAFQPPAP